MSVILMYSDAAKDLQELSQALCELGHRVKTVATGKQALRQAQRVPQPALVLLDVAMPGMDGLEVCRRLRASLRTHHTPIIFLTVEEDKDVHLAMFKAGAVNYLVRPFNLDIALAIIQSWLHQSESFTQIRAQVQYHAGVIVIIKSYLAFRGYDLEKEKWPPSPFSHE